MLYGNLQSQAFIFPSAMYNVQPRIVFPFLSKIINITYHIIILFTVCFLAISFFLFYFCDLTLYNQTKEETVSFFLSIFFSFFWRKL